MREGKKLCIRMYICLLIFKYQILTTGARVCVCVCVCWGVGGGLAAMYKLKQFCLETKQKDENTE